ncbi:MAG: leucyl/phenylalanyl-tRNA--protein transferase [Thiomicrospira sp.]
MSKKRATSSAPFLIDSRQTPSFPPTRLAMREPNGLLAISFSLSVSWLLAAYRQGIFPWSSEDEPIMWWSPAPRTVLFTDQIKLRRSLRQVMRQQEWQLSFDHAFDRVLHHCSTIERPGQDGTWLRADLQAALLQLHQQGYAHSVEVWQQGRLVGGLYGIAIGRVFFGESMFSLIPNASKIALVMLAKQLAHWGFEMIDCQMETPHLLSMGACNLSREAFEHQLQQGLAQPAIAKPWHFEPALLNEHHLNHRINATEGKFYDATP